MADYAGYETFEEFHRGALTTVWKARRRGGADAQLFCVKTCRPPVWDASEAEAAAAHIREFLDSVDEQRVLAERGAQHWVPILAAGQKEDEGFAVSRFFPRSLERVIEGRAALQAEDIRWIALAIATGLSELERELDRPHGNVQPGNVFIDSDGRITGSPVLLGDLKPRRELDITADRSADFRALGRIIVHLARRQHANLQAAIGWPLEAGPEWRRFGRDGVHWRNLCNLLLNPHPEEVRHDWGFVIERVRGLGVSGRRPWIPIAAAVPVCVALLAVGYLRFRNYDSIPARFQSWAEALGNVPPDVTEVPPEWGEICVAYNEWLGGFMSDIGKPAVSANWMRQPHLRDAVIGALVAVRDEDKLKDLSPYEIAGVMGDLETLRLHPPEKVKDGIISRRVIKVAAAVKGAQGAFAAWPDRVQLLDLATRYESRGWTQVAAGIRGVAAVGELPPITGENINAVLELAQAAGGTEALWAELERRAGLLAGAGDPVMGGILDYLGARGATAGDLAALNQVLTEATQATERWLRFVRGGPGGRATFDRARFAAESDLSGFSGPVTPEVLERWERAVAQFEYVSGGDDPRRTTDFWNGLLRPIDEAIATIRDVERAGLASGASGGLQSSRDDARRQVDALLARAVVRKDIQALTEEVARLSRHIEDLATSARKAVMDVAPRPADWLAFVQQTRHGADGSSLRREWERRRQQLLAGATPATLSSPTEPKFIELRTSFNELNQFFAALDGNAGVKSLAVVDTTGIAPAAAESLQRWAATRVDRTVAAWLERARWGQRGPAETFEAMIGRPEIRAVTEAHAAAMTDAARFGRDLSDFDARLAAGAGTDDPAYAALGAWRTHPVFTEWRDLPGVGAVLERADLLARLGEETRVQALVDAAASPILGHAWTAWRRLGAISGWPGALQIEDELRLATDLQRRIGQSAGDPSRAAAMRAEIEKELPRRWRVALRGSLDDASVRRVAERREAFGVREDDLNAPERFNLELLRIRQTDWASLTPDRMAAARDDIVNRTQALFGPSLPPDISNWLKRLSELQLATGGVVVDVTKLGPGRMPGWVGQTGGDDRRVEFRRTFGARTHRLAFLLVEAEPAAPFYLCTTEMTVGLAIDLASDPAVRSRLGSSLRPAILDEDGLDRRSGPQSWRLERDGALRLLGDWMPMRLPTWPTPLYAEDVPPPSTPTRAAPLQYVPASVAAYFADDLLGCRLPTPDEWRALVGAGLTRPAMGVLSNLRDGVWQRESDYLVSREMLSHQSPIDADIFWPASAGLPKRLAESRAAVPDRDDGLLLFADVEIPGQAGLQHLLGNVAEFLFDVDRNRFYVAGGSALSPPDVDPETPYPLDNDAAQTGYSDVGLRLAFDAPATLTGRTRLLQLIRNQPYLRL